ncbi:MAG: biopolymer transporter ExbD [Prevotellaceae bacterium]|jgi:biopolymer transport protein ExbD|nr:biopolymer transporter ExbD [Prevotellaceae bacterium]
MALKRNSKITSSFSMASMTDIVFLLLIFFMVTSTLINPNALQLLLPKSNSQTSLKQKVSVSIKHLGQDKYEYYVNKKHVTVNEIEQNLQVLLRNTEDPVVSLYVDETIPVSQVVKLMNIATRNRFRMILAAKPE